MKNDICQEFEFKIPGSIANLGPGLDTLALAVQLYVRVQVRVLNGLKASSFRFVGFELSGENYIERAMRFAARQCCVQLPSLEIVVDSDIPMCAGLGSSAAATVAGLRIFEALTEPLSRERVLDFATLLEGHPDNAAASILGGFTASCRLENGQVCAVRLHWPKSIRLIVVTPNLVLSTRDARAVLPRTIPMVDAIFNLQRVALLLAALSCEDHSYFREAISDRLHQPYRECLVPGLKEVTALKHPNIHGACLSGAGPSTVIFASTADQTIVDLVRNCYRSLGLECAVRALEVHSE